MKTPWGPLDVLDPDDIETCRQILAADKHQIAEGLVVEHLLDQILNIAASFTGRQGRFLDIETVLILEREEWIALVWPRIRQPGLGRYLQALGKECRTFVLEFREGQFWAREYYGDSWAAGEWLELTALMARLSGRNASSLEVDESVRDTTRQQQSFWGYLSQQYRGQLGQKIALPRLLLNHGVQPWFRNVWNVDRVLLDGKTLWHFEIKHKFPYGHRTLKFGINAGELGMLQMLGRCGIRGLHVILVKPIWSKNEGSMYLLNSLELRQRAALIAAELTPALLGLASASGRRTSASHTTLSGRETQTYYGLAGASFTRLGSLADNTGALAEALRNLLDGHPGAPVTDEWLRRQKVE